MLLPIIFIFNHAFKPWSELFRFPPTFFVREPTWLNFQRLMLATAGDIVPFSRYAFNSVTISVITLACVVIVSAMAAYILSKFKFRFKPAIMSMIMIALMFAPETVAIPRYLMISSLGLNDTYFGHVLPYLASPVAVFLVKQFMDQIPDTYLEAARIDGAGQWHLFARMMLPLSSPALATVAILTFQGVWMDVESSALYMKDETMKTIPFYVLSLTNGLQNNVAGQGLAAAAALLLFLPNFLMFLAFQKRVIETMVHSGVK